jgi:iron(III) transport system substrate-binding protein
MKRYLASLLAMVMLMATVTGCQSGANSSTPTPASTQAVTPTPTPTAVADDKGWSSEYYNDSMKGTTLNLYGVTDAIVPVLDAFTEDTGIIVENLTLKNGEILQRVTNEHDSGNVIADIWFTGGADAFISAADSGLLTAYQSPAAADIADDMKDTSGYWTGTSLTVVNWVINTEIIEELGIEVPTKWDDLLQPELKGLVSMPDPASSGTAYNSISAILQTRGEEAGWTYLEQLIEQVPYFTARGSDPANNVIAGEAAVGINAGTGNRALEEDYPQVELVYPTDGTGWWPQPVAILDGCSHPDEAKVFIDWVLSDRGLEEVGKAQNAMLVKDDVPAPEGIMALSEIALFPTDFKANAADRDAILAKWAEKTGT